MTCLPTASPIYAPVLSLASDQGRTGMGTIARRLSPWIIASLTVIGLYFPTSIEGRISTELLIAASAAMGIGLLSLVIACGIAGALQFAIAASVFVIIGIATLFSPFTEIAYGALMPISLLTALLCVQLRWIPGTTALQRTFTIINWVNLLAVVLIVAEVREVSRLLIDSYSAFYPELVPSMLGAGKPVLTFATHSLAGFFFYLFFYMCLRSYVVTGRRLHYLFAFSYVVVLILVNSFSSYMFAALAVLQLLFRFNKRRPLLIALPALIVAGLAIALAVPETTIVHEQLSAIGNVLSLDTNGLRGRYSGQGALTSNLRYITSSPFSPVGAGFHPDLMYGDSGVIEFLLRGSVPLVLFIYTGLFLFLRRNLVSRSQALFLFAVLFGFEIGFSNLLYFRTQLFLPFVVVYLNHLERIKSGHMEVESCFQ